VLDPRLHQRCTQVAGDAIRLLRDLSPRVAQNDIAGGAERQIGVAVALDGRWDSCAARLSSSTIRRCSRQTASALNPSTDRFTSGNGSRNLSQNSRKSTSRGLLVSASCGR
jgi:hypothetical protein